MCCFAKWCMEKGTMCLLLLLGTSHMVTSTAVSTCLVWRRVTFPHVCLPNFHEGKTPSGLRQPPVTRCHLGTLKDGPDVIVTLTCARPRSCRRSSSSATSKPLQVVRACTCSCFPHVTTLQYRNILADSPVLYIHQPTSNIPQVLWIPH